MNMKSGPILPNGMAHVAFLMQAEDRMRRKTSGVLVERHKPELDLIGTSLNVLYQAATCERGCKGGGHFLERLCGRAYNMGQGALSLTLIGLYTRR
jgi:hypothetical protein